MSRYSSDSKSRASKKAKAVIEDLKRDLKRRKVIQPEQEYIPNGGIAPPNAPWWLR